MKQIRPCLPAIVVAVLAFGPSPLWSQVGVEVEKKGGASVGTGQQGATGQGSQGSSATATMSSEEIKKLQQALKEKGQDPGPINGEMNAKTQAALKAYQQQQGLKATGSLDVQTRTALGLNSGGSSRSGSAAPSSGGSPAGTTTIKPGEPIPPAGPSRGGAKGGASGSVGGGAGTQ